MIHQSQPQENEINSSESEDGVHRQVESGITNLVDMFRRNLSWHSVQQAADQVEAAANSRHAHQVQQISDEDQRQNALQQHMMMYANENYEEGDSEDAEYEEYLELDEDVVNPVSKQFLNQLPVSKFTAMNRENFSEENKQCTICLCQYDTGDEYMILPCLHRFHKDCVTQWFERKNTCPNCKENVGGQVAAQQQQHLPQMESFQRSMNDSLLDQLDEQSNYDNQQSLQIQQMVNRNLIEVNSNEDDDYQKQIQAMLEGKSEEYLNDEDDEDDDGENSASFGHDIIANIRQNLPSNQATFPRTQNNQANRQNLLRQQQEQNRVFRESEDDEDSDGLMKMYARNQNEPSMISENQHQINSFYNNTDRTINNLMNMEAGLQRMQQQINQQRQQNAAKDQRQSTIQQFPNMSQTLNEDEDSHVEQSAFDPMNGDDSNDDIYHEEEEEDDQYDIDAFDDQNEQSQELDEDNPSYMDDMNDVI